MTDKNKNLVVQANKIIEAKYKLSVSEQRLIKFLVSLIEKDDEDFKPYHISVSNLADLLELKRKDYYKAVKETTKGLIGKVLTFESSGRTIQASWLASADYHDGEGFVILQFAPILKPFLLLLKSHFTVYELKNVIRLKHTHSIRVYELLKQYESIGRRRFLIDELRSILMLGEDEYKQFSDFRKRVLSTSQKELEEKTDISFSWIEQKVGKRCIAIEFLIKPQQCKQVHIKETILSTPDISKQEEIEIKQDNPVIEQLVKFGISQKVAEELAKQHEERKINCALALTEAKQKQGKLDNPAGFLIKAIKEGFKDSQTEENGRKEQEKQARAQKERLAKETKAKETLAKQTAIDAFLKELSSEERLGIETEFLQHSKDNSTLMNAFNKHGWGSALVMGNFRNFILANKLA